MEIKNAYLVTFYGDGHRQFMNFFFSKQDAYSAINSWFNYPTIANCFCYVERFERGILIPNSGKGISRHNARENQKILDALDENE